MTLGSLKPVDTDELLATPIRPEIIDVQHQEIPDDDNASSAEADLPFDTLLDDSPSQPEPAVVRSNSGVWQSSASYTDRIRQGAAAEPAEEKGWFDTLAEAASDVVDRLLCKACDVVGVDPKDIFGDDLNAGESQALVELGKGYEILRQAALNTNPEAAAYLDQLKNAAATLLPEAKENKSQTKRAARAERQSQQLLTAPQVIYAPLVDSSPREESIVEDDASLEFAFEEVNQEAPKQTKAAHAEDCSQADVEEAAPVVVAQTQEGEARQSVHTSDAGLLMTTEASSASVAVAAPVGSPVIRVATTSEASAQAVFGSSHLSLTLASVATSPKPVVALEASSDKGADLTEVALPALAQAANQVTEPYNQSSQITPKKLKDSDKDRQADANDADADTNELAGINNQNSSSAGTVVAATRSSSAPAVDTATVQRDNAIRESVRAADTDGVSLAQRVGGSEGTQKAAKVDEQEVASLARDNEAQLHTVRDNTGTETGTGDNPNSSIEELYAQVIPDQGDEAIEVDIRDVHTARASSTSRTPSTYIS